MKAFTCLYDVDDLGGAAFLSFIMSSELDAVAINFSWWWIESYNVDIHKEFKNL